MREVKTADGCFAIDTLSTQSSETLIVFVHGDGGAGSWGHYRASYAEAFGAMTGLAATTVVLARPGYALADGRRSWGIPTTAYDNYTGPVVRNIADALANLKGRIGAKRLILVGHSGGAMISGILVGRHPGIADAALLVAFACDTDDWRAWRQASRGRGLWTASLSARDYIDGVPADFRLRAVTGGFDDNTKAELAKPCIDALTGRGVDATLTVVSGADHSGVMADDAVTQALSDLMPSP